MNPAVKYVSGNLIALHPRRPEFQRVAEVEAKVRAVRVQPRPAPVSQYERADRLALWLALGVLVLLALHIMSVGGPG